VSELVNSGVIKGFACFLCILVLVIVGFFFVVVMKVCAFENLGV